MQLTSSRGLWINATPLGTHNPYSAVANPLGLLPQIITCWYAMDILPL